MSEGVSVRVLWGARLGWAGSYYRDEGMTFVVLDTTSERVITISNKMKICMSEYPPSSRKNKCIEDAFQKVELRSLNLSR